MKVKLTKYPATYDIFGHHLGLPWNVGMSHSKLCNLFVSWLVCLRFSYTISPNIVPNFIIWGLSDSNNFTWPVHDNTLSGQDLIIFISDCYLLLLSSTAARVDTNRRRVTRIRYITGVLLRDNWRRPSPSSSSRKTRYWHSLNRTPRNNRRFRTKFTGLGTTLVHHLLCSTAELLHGHPAKAATSRHRIFTLGSGLNASIPWLDFTRFQKIESVGVSWFEYE
jgi:hypothetical protein